MVELCINSNRSAVLESSATIYMPHESPMPQLNESGVSPLAKRYMRAGIGNDRLVVCLSEYLP